MRCEWTVAILMVFFAPATDTLAQSIDALNPQPNVPPTTLAIQADGKTILAGAFATIGATPTANIVRLNIDGSLDPGFASPAVNGEVKSVVVQADGKILIGGDFTAVGTTTRHYLARLDANGALDSGFADPNLNATVWTIVVQPDSKVLAGGEFTKANGNTRTWVARYSSAGVFDGTFADTKLCCGGESVRALAVQADGGVLVGGFFSQYGSGAPPNYRFYLARYSSSGVFDNAFPDDQPGSAITDLGVAPDGSILVGNGFLTSNNMYTRPLAKLTSTGTLVSAFADLQNDGGTHAFVLQPNGKIVICGTFQSIGGQPRHALARLNADGSLDAAFGDLHFSFNAGDANGYIYGIAAQADGKVAAIGNFTLANNQSRQYMARVATNDAVSSELTGQASGSNVVVAWTRTGDGPELAHAPTLLHSSDGATFTPVGTMTRIGNGWQLTAPFNVAGTPFYLKATAYTSEGAGNGSPGRIDSPVYVSDRIFANGFE
jgi:uncharacterized delta-60 repeat protein